MDIEKIKRQIKQAHTAVGESCKRGHLRMSVPVREEEDDDCVIAAGLNAAEELLTRVAELEAENAELRQEVAGLEWDGDHPEALDAKGDGA